MTHHTIERTDLVFKSATAPAGVETKRLFVPSMGAAKMADDGKTLTGYGSVFGNVDLDKDIIDHGAFADDLAEFLADGFLGWMHDWGDSSGPPVGYFLEATEDDHGLFLSARFHSTANADQVRVWAQERLAAGKSVGLSIGFRILGWERDAAGLRHITKAKLYEVSVVTVPANPKAQVTGIKSRPTDPGAPSSSDLERRSLAVRSSTLPSSSFELDSFEPAGHAVVDQRGYVLDDLGPGALSGKMAQVVAGSSYKEAFRTYLRKGLSGLGQTHLKTLQEGNDEQGGFLVPTDVSSRIISRAPTPTRVSSRVTRIPTSRDRIRVPKVNYSADDVYSTGARVTWTGEIPTSSTQHRVTDPAFGQIGISVFTAMLSMDITLDMVEDTSFPLVTWVADKMAETYGLLQDELILTGPDIGRPAGILLDPDGTDQPASVKTGSAAALTADGLLDLTWAIPEQYDENSAWVFNKTSTGKAIAKLKDADNRYLWAQFEQSGLMMSARQRPLMGYPVLFSGFMPNVAADAFPAIFGDLTGYFLVERVGLSIQVLREKYAEENKIVVLGRVRFGGLVAEPWKLRIHKVAA